MQEMEMNPPERKINNCIIETKCLLIFLYIFILWPYHLVILRTLVFTPGSAIRHHYQILPKNNMGWEGLNPGRHIQVPYPLCCIIVPDPKCLLFKNTHLLLELFNNHIYVNIFLFHLGIVGKITVFHPIITASCF